MKGLKCYHDMLSMIHFKKYQDLITNNMLPCCRTIQIYTHCNAPAISQAATHLSALRQAVFPYITFYDVIQPPPPQPREPSELPPPPPPSTTRSRRAQSPLHARAHTHTHTGHRPPDTQSCRPGSARAHRTRPTAVCWSRVGPSMHPLAASPLRRPAAAAALMDGHGEDGRASSRRPPRGPRPRRRPRPSRFQVTAASRFRVAAVGISAVRGGEVGEETAAPRD